MQEKEKWTRDSLKTTLIGILKEIAPEIDENHLASHVSLRDQTNLDSLDLIAFLDGIYRKLQVNIPESDYAKLTTLDALLDYLKGALT